MLMSHDGSISRFTRKFVKMILLPLAAAMVDASAAQVQISGVEFKFEEQQGLKMSYLTWLRPQEVEKNFRVEFPPSPDWKAAKVVFTPQSGGHIVIRLFGPEIPGGAHEKYKNFGVYYDNLSVNGKLVPNGDFEKGGEGFAFYNEVKDYPGRIVENPGAAQSGRNCALAWAGGQLAFAAEAVKGEPMTLAFDYRDCLEVPPIAEQNSFYPLPLASVANMGFADETADDGKGGWTDQGPGNDLHAFSGGLKEFNSWPYEVVYPARNGGKACVIFKSKHTPFGAQSITLPVNQVCNAICLLDTCAWTPKTQDVVAKVTVNFAGKPSKEFPVVANKDVAEWWNPVSLPNAEVAWTTANGNCLVGLYSTVLRLGETAKVDSVTISVLDQDPVYCLVGVTAGLVRKDAKDELKKLSYSLELGGKTALAALPLDCVKLDMREDNFPADKFFSVDLDRLALSDEDGAPLDFAVAKYVRNLEPVILVKAKKPFSRVTLKLTGDVDARKTFPPRVAFQKICGLDAAPYGVESIPGVVLTPGKAKCVNLELQPDEDSFHNTMAVLGDKAPTMECEFELKEPKTLKLFVLARSPRENGQANRFYVSFDGGEEIVVGGVHGKKYLTSYWSGGQKVSLAPGKHVFRMKDMGVIKGLAFSRFLLAEGDHTPWIPGFREEALSLRNAGFDVYGLPKDVDFKHVASRDPIHRIVNAEKSFPDLSALSNTDIDKDGALRADGVEMEFASGKKVPFIWGCNLEFSTLAEVCDESRVGEKGFDVMMKRIKAMGYSSVRTFFGSMPRVRWTNINNKPMFLLSSNPLKYHPDFLKNMQLLIAAAHRNGLYLNISFWTENYRYGDVDNGCGEAGFIHPEAIRRQKEVIRMLLDTPNPYRDNIRPADDPTLAICEIENERGFGGNSGFGVVESWKKLPDDTKTRLYTLWHEFLKNKYHSFANVKASWGAVPILAGNTTESVDNIDFPPFWDIKEWGKDKSIFSVKMDDLRVTSAAYGVDKRSNAAVSDAMEFLYHVYVDYYKEMYGYFRELGFKGVLTACGADLELYYMQRAASNATLDAVSGGTSYWNRSGYGFLRTLSWMDPLVYAATPDKPMISREYGANLTGENCWWGNLMSASIQKSMDKAYLFNFSLGVMGADIPSDYLYPDDSFEKRAPIWLEQETHLYSHFANLASAIAVQSSELRSSDFKLEIADPLDNVCYAAPFRGKNKMTINNFVPFLYTDSFVRTFLDTYDGKANLVVNEPATPTGDYSKAKNVFFIRPHSALDRYGKDASAWLNGKTFSAEGFMTKREEQLKLYDAIIKAGGKMPVSREEYCDVWRDSQRKLEIDTRSATFRAETSTFGAFIGSLGDVAGKRPRQYSLEGAGDAWTFFGKAPSGDLLFAVMNGRLDLKEHGKTNYMMLGGSDLAIFLAGKPFVRLLGGGVVNVSLKAEGDSLGDASKVYVTFFQSKSCQTPAELEFGDKVRAVYACNRDGVRLAEIPHTEKSFSNLWTHGNEISYYEVVFGIEIFGYTL